MKRAYFLFRKELTSIFVSPVAWIIMVLFTLVMGANLYLSMIAVSGDLKQLVAAGYGGLVSWFMLLVIPPLITMKSLADEKVGCRLDFLCHSLVLFASSMGNLGNGGCPRHRSLVRDPYGIVRRGSGLLCQWDSCFCTHFSSSRLCGISIHVQCGSLHDPLAEVFLPTGRLGIALGGISQCGSSHR